MDGGVRGGPPSIPSIYHIDGKSLQFCFSRSLKITQFISFFFPFFPFSLDLPSFFLFFFSPNFILSLFSSFFLLRFIFLYFLFSARLFFILPNLIPSFFLFVFYRVCVCFACVSLCLLPVCSFFVFFSLCFPLFVTVYLPSIMCLCLFIMCLCLCLFCFCLPPFVPCLFFLCVCLKCLEFGSHRLFVSVLLPFPSVCCLFVLSLRLFEVCGVWFSLGC